MNKYLECMYEWASTAWDCPFCYIAECEGQWREFLGAGNDSYDCAFTCPHAIYTKLNRERCEDLGQKAWRKYKDYFND